MEYWYRITHENSRYLAYKLYDSFIWKRRIMEYW
jgi:hypothetical protein